MLDNQAPGLRDDITAEAVAVLHDAANNMPLSRPGQAFEGAAQWLHRRAEAFADTLRRHGTPAHNRVTITETSIGPHRARCERCGAQSDPNHNNDTAWAWARHHLSEPCPPLIIVTDSIGATP